MRVTLWITTAIHLDTPNKQSLTLAVLPEFGDNVIERFRSVF